ncbi:hypothetical protein O1U_0741 [Candidatus Photodesmus katoptron Akat1]|uniref:SPOR domain-containing protein n=1 Tax=Candidatus Photodesmus katoptron Akat1 TaxID=1236703 RepID=S3EGZ2_9GAMM|nr:hypothetical protein O1U_0741 [Candidatus Photodesmus katoptron Akat1]
MGSKFQNRLVGTIVLVSITVIVLPDLLDGEKIRYEDPIESIPIRSWHEDDVRMKLKILEPIKEQVMLPNSPVTEIQGKFISPNNPTQENPLSVIVNSNPHKNKYENSAWIIQLMALKNFNSADNVVQDLKQRGYQAHIKKKIHLQES